MEPKYLSFRRRLYTPIIIWQGDRIPRALSTTILITSISKGITAKASCFLNSLRNLDLQNKVVGKTDKHILPNSGFIGKNHMGWDGIRKKRQTKQTKPHHCAVLCWSHPKIGSCIFPLINFCVLKTYPHTPNSCTSGCTKVKQHQLGFNLDWMIRWGY